MTKQASTKAAPKFKKGDKVVFTGTNWHFQKGEKLTIESHYISSGKHQNICYWLEEVNGEPCIESDLTCEKAHNSPLYRALR